MPKSESGYGPSYMPHQGIMSAEQKKGLVDEKREAISSLEAANTPAEIRAALEIVFKSYIETPDSELPQLKEKILIISRDTLKTWKADEKTE
jgi:hypothetical protein